MKTDVLIVGSGCSGLYCALSFRGKRKLLLSPKPISKAAIHFSLRAEYAYCAARLTTMLILKTLCAPDTTKMTKPQSNIRLRSHSALSQTLVDCGVLFERDKDGAFLYTR